VHRLRTACRPGRSDVHFSMLKRSSKKPTDLNELAKSMLDKATSEDQPEAPAGDTDTSDGKNPAAVALGRLGGKKGGPARAKKLSKKKRSAIAKKAARKRWGYDD